MSDNKKPKEWMMPVMHAKPFDGDDNIASTSTILTYVHVIEHSAYDALQKENEELKKVHDEQVTLIKHLQYICNQIERPNDSLRASLKEAVEALSFNKQGDMHLVNPSVSTQQINAIVSFEVYDKIDKALAKIKAKHGELK